MYLENVDAATSIFSSDSPSSPANWVAIAAHSNHNLVLDATGHVAAWGDQTNVPAGLANVSAIAAGGSHNLALLGDTLPFLSSQMILTNPVVDIAGFHFSLQTRNGKVYAAQFRDSLENNSWNNWPLVAGNGGAMNFTDPAATNSQRFYRVRQW